MSREIVHPGPIDDSLLRLQPFHISEHIWNGAKNRVVKVRRATQSELREVEIPDAIRDLLERAGFMGVAQISYFPVDNHLISALVERWRPETHTFHMPFGECTITLEDVAMLLGLKISGAPITGYATMDWAALVQRLLGMTPPESVLVGGRLRMSWIDRHFSDVSEHVHSQEQLERYTRAFILRMIGGYLLTDHSSSFVSLRYLALLEDLDACGHMSWGSCVLANMYRELCVCTNYDHKEIGGSAILVQLWAWYRLPVLAPPHPPLSTFHVPLGARWNRALHKPKEEKKDKIVKYRKYFDRLKRGDFVWQPYLELLPTLPPYCFEDSQVWRSTVPLINFHIVEYHYADRVMRQFGMVQHIPAPPIHSEKLHDLSLRGKDNMDWSRMHVQFVQEWQSRFHRVWTQAACDTPHLSNNSEYMVWYRKHTKRWISPSSAKKGYVTDVLEHMYHGTSEKHRHSFDFTAMHESIGHCLQLQDEVSRVSFPSTPAPPATLVKADPVEVEYIGAGRREGRGLSRRRRRVEHQDLQMPVPPTEPPAGTYYLTTLTPYGDITQYVYGSAQDISACETSGSKSA